MPAQVKPSGELKQLTILLIEAKSWDTMTENRGLSKAIIQIQVHGAFLLHFLQAFA